MGILDDRSALVEEFAAYPDWETRYRRIIQLGRALPQMEEAMKIEENRVRGCASAVWLYSLAIPGVNGGPANIRFLADSDALLVRGLIALLLRVYNRRTPREILDVPPDFIEELGLNFNLSVNRANGLTSITGRIREHALAFQGTSAG